MSSMVGIVNYGISGNIHSIKKAIEKAGANTLVVNSPSDFDLVDKVVIPGVGSFKNAMQELENNGLIASLKEFDKPILGICLGMQILSELGFEFGKTKGLGLIDAEVKPILCDAKIPHMGFNKIQVVNPNKLMKGLEDKADSAGPEGGEIPHLGEHLSAKHPLTRIRGVESAQHLQEGCLAAPA